MFGEFIFLVKETLGMNETNERSLLYKYYNEFYPFTAIIRFMKMNRSNMNLQYRDITLFPRDERYVSKRCNRVLDENLKKELLKRSNILSIHQGAITLVSVQTTSISLQSQTITHYDEYEDEEEEEEYETRDCNTSLPIQTTIPLIVKEGSLYSENTLMDKFEVSRTIKEFPIDIDLTDYKRICSCGANKTVCETCWLHLEGTALILNDILINRYGVDPKNIMWVFSGAKGIHCFVNDVNMIKMNDIQRMNIYDDIAIDKENDYANIQSKFNNLFYSSVLLDDIQSLFYEKVLGQKRHLLDGKRMEFQDFALGKIRRHYNHLYKLVKETWQSMDSKDTNGSDCEKSILKWNALKRIEETCHQKGTTLKASMYIILSLYHPMIDKEPLKVTHLIKLPFSIHKTSGKIAIPLDLTSITNYDVIQQIPTLDVFIGQGKYANVSLFERGVCILDQWTLSFY
jgi:DNA primase catalytic subunit